MKNQTFIALGSNIGDREHYLRKAIEKIKAHPNVNVISESPIYETAPVGVTDQPSFLNMVVYAKTDEEPLSLLYFLQAIEQDLKRTRDRRWGPRTIDLDILLYNDENIELSDLIIPHPCMQERAFVLVPLSDLAPNHVHPVLEVTIQDLLKQLPQADIDGVERWQPV